MFNTKHLSTSSTDTEFDLIDECELVNRFQNGDTETFNPLMLKYQQKIYHMVYNKVRNRETAEDLCQDIFLKAFKALPNFKQESTFYSWIYKIALNCCIDYQRKRKREIVFAIEDLPPNTENKLRMIDTQPSPPQMLENKELGEIIRKAIRHLPPCRRQVFNLRYQKELPIKEIAFRLNRSEGTIKTHLHHAHRQLRDMLLPYIQDASIEWAEAPHQKNGEKV